jgi:hypothetical protein
MGEMSNIATEFADLTTTDIVLNGAASAMFSMDRRYRYVLRRRLWRPAAKHESLRLVCVLLNPSIASATASDPTLRKCMGFASRWGYNELCIVNLFAFVATEPNALFAAADPIGPLNQHVLRVEIGCAHAVLLGWGSHRAVRLAAPSIATVIESHPKASCLGVNKDGSPKHPLYVPYATKPTHWSAPP